MKILYLYTQAEKDIRSSGEAKKMLMQLSGLQQNDIMADCHIQDRSATINKLLIRMPFFQIHNKAFRKILLGRLKEYDAIYIRKNIFDGSFLKMLKEIHIEYPEKKIIIEIPTYPYDFEWSNCKDFPLLIKDKIHRNRLKRYVDKLVVFSNDKEAFGIPCIRTSNGIDVNAISMRCSNKIDDEKILLLGVAGVERWHGFDRVIRGLSSYYEQGGKKEIIFHVVGHGRESNNLVRLVKKLALENKVIFHGSLHGEELDKMFDMCDIGVGSLGMYRINMFDGYTLKLREYMVRGIPFIFGYNDKLIELSHLPYIVKVSNDNEEINMNMIAEFAEYLKSCDEKDVAAKMNAYAAKELTWRQQMKPVADYLKNTMREG